MQACLFSWENKVPLIAFSEGRCLTLFDHPLVDSLHAVYQEPKVRSIIHLSHTISFIPEGLFSKHKNCVGRDNTFS